MQRDGLGEEALVAADTDAGEDREQVRQTEASVNSKLDQVMQKAEKDGIIQRVDGVTLLCRLADGSRVDEFQVAFGLDDEGEPEKLTPSICRRRPHTSPMQRATRKVCWKPSRTSTWARALANTAMIASRPFCVSVASATFSTEASVPARHYSSPQKVESKEPRSAGEQPHQLGHSRVGRTLQSYQGETVRL